MDDALLASNEKSCHSIMETMQADIDVYFIDLNRQDTRSWPIEFLKVRDMMLWKGEIQFEKFLQKYPYEINLNKIINQNNEDILIPRIQEWAKPYGDKIVCFPGFAMGRYKHACNSIFTTDVNLAMYTRLTFSV